MENLDYESAITILKEKGYKINVHSNGINLIDPTTEGSFPCTRENIIEIATAESG